MSAGLNVHHLLAAAFLLEVVPIGLILFPTVSTAQTSGPPSSVVAQQFREMARRTNDAFGSPLIQFERLQTEGVSTEGKVATVLAVGWFTYTNAAPGVTAIWGEGLGSCLSNSNEWSPLYGLRATPGGIVGCRVRMYYRLFDTGWVFELMTFTQALGAREAASAGVRPGGAAAGERAAWSRTPAIPETPGPRIRSHSASSTLAPQAGNRYDPANSTDGNTGTAWIEGAAGAGIGEWLLIELTSPAEIGRIEIWGGYGKSLAAYQANSRPKKVRVSFNGKSPIEFEVEDRFGWQEFPLQPPRRADAIRIEIRDVWKGSKYDDTAISEVRFK